MKKEKIANTKKKDQRIARANAEYAYNNRRWTHEDLYYAYERPSYAKQRAWQYCKDLRNELGGWDMLVSSHNTFSFSVVFKFLDEDGRLCYAYITRDYDRFCYAEEEQEAKKSA